MKRILAGITALMLALMLGIGGALAQGEGACWAIVQGGNSDRVHLRAGASTGSASLGLYFTGAPVLWLGDAGNGWSMVCAGTQTGYMMSKYLSRQAALPVGTVTAQATLMDQPQNQAVALLSCPSGQTVTVMGETGTQWYYVAVNGHVGYLPAGRVSVTGGTVTPPGTYGMATLNGLTSDRVHLRARASANSASLGLYFTGTEVTLRSEVRNGWVPVTIGAVDGYVDARYLVFNGTVAGRQPTMTVRNPNSSWVNLRAAPSTSAKSLGTLYNGNQVTVLGETSTHWYYVSTASGRGYVVGDFLK